MKQTLLLFSLFFGIVLNSNAQESQQQEYTGSVGKLNAIFNLAWHKDGSVSGSYYYLSRPAVTYSLSGNNHTTGQLFLYEYTPKKAKPTASMTLVKTKSGGTICWNGTMNNTDGRNLKISLCR